MTCVRVTDCECGGVPVGQRLFRTRSRQWRAFLRRVLNLLFAYFAVIFFFFGGQCLGFRVFCIRALM